MKQCEKNTQGNTRKRQVGLLETEKVLMQLVQIYIKDVYVGYFGAGYYKYKVLAMKIDVIQDSVSTE